MSCRPQLPPSLLRKVYNSQFASLSLFLVVFTPVSRDNSVSKSISSSSWLLSSVSSEVPCSETSYKDFKSGIPKT